MNFKKIFVHACFFCLCLPDYSTDFARHAIIWNGLYVPNWDSNNAVTWAYMIKNGYLPFIDFWYPYSGSFLFDLIFPFGKTIFFIYLCILWGLLFELLQGFIFRFWDSFLFVIFLIFCSQLVVWESESSQGGIFGILPQPERYLLPILLSISFLSSLFKMKSDLYFYCILLLTLVFETSQLLYFCTTILLISPAVFLFNEKKQLIFITAKKIVISLGILIIFCIGLQKAKMFNEIFSFYLSVPLFPNYMAIPTSIEFSLGNILSEGFLILYGFMYLGFIFANLNLKKQKEKIVCILIMMLIITTYSFSQKHIIRPIENALLWPQIILFPIIWNQCLRNKGILDRQKLSVSFLIILLLISIIYLSPQQRLKENLRRIITLKNLLCQPLNKIKDSVFEIRTNALCGERFISFSEEKELVNLLKPHSFFVLNDNPILYILSNKKPPFQFNSFSLSPKKEQEKLVKKLISDLPENIVIDRRNLQFDGVQNQVRLPILYSWVVNNYTFKESHGFFDILEKINNKIEKINANYWSKLFQETNYGNIFSQARLHQGLKESKIIQISKNEFSDKAEDIRLKFKTEQDDILINFIMPQNVKSINIKIESLWFHEILTYLNEITIEPENKKYKIEVIDMSLQDSLY